MKNIRLFSLIGLVMCVTAAAAPITYTGSFTTTGASADTVSYAITTDGAIGVLTLANITSITFSAVGLAPYGTTVADNSKTDLTAGILSATSSDLAFDFGQTNGRFQFVGPAANNRPFVTFSGPFIVGPFSGPAAKNTSTACCFTDLQVPSVAAVIATAAPASVPEPGTSVMALGALLPLGLAALKRRRQARQS